MLASYDFVAEPVARTNSFVGTEEYLAPEVITGAAFCYAMLLFGPHSLH